MRRPLRPCRAVPPGEDRGARLRRGAAFLSSRVAFGSSPATALSRQCDSLRAGARRQCQGRHFRARLVCFGCKRTGGLRRLPCSHLTVTSPVGCTVAMIGGLNRRSARRMTGRAVARICATSLAGALLAPTPKKPLLRVAVPVARGGFWRYVDLATRRPTVWCPRSPTRRRPFHPAQTTRRGFPRARRLRRHSRPSRGRSFCRGID